jgi:hypothetical protein
MLAKQKFGKKLETFVEAKLQEDTPDSPYRIGIGSKAE